MRESRKLEMQSPRNRLPTFSRRERGPAGPRRGVAVLVVLLLLSVTMALSYAAMRSQSVAVCIQKNSVRQLTAKQDALTGITMAIRKMYSSTWAGVDTTLQGTLGLYDRFQVTYATGDASLTPSNSSYSDFPYRVTLLSTGYSTDPSSSQNVTTYKIRVVMRFVPRQLASEPSGWSSMLGYTVYQYQFGAFDVEEPSRIEGPVYTQALVGISQDIWPADFSHDWNITAAGLQYYADLNLLRIAQGLDWRPYNAAMSLWTWQMGDTPTVLNGLGITQSKYSWPATINWNPASYMSTYCIYPGGKQYTVQPVAGSLQGAPWQPDMVNNPLGIYYASGRVDIYDSATLQGTLVTAGMGDVNVHGRGITFNPVSMPPLYGTTAPVQLPVVAGGGDFTIAANAGITISGQVAAAGTFDVASAGQTSTSMTFLGQLIAGAVSIEARSEWLGQSAGWWQGKVNSFSAQKDHVGGIKYFPQYLQQTTNMDPTPRLIIKPSASPVRYHWQSWNAQQNPIFVPNAADGGLRWDLVSWTETGFGS
jgi:hypothetical protein